MSRPDSLPEARLPGAGGRGAIQRRRFMALLLIFASAAVAVPLGLHLLVLLIHHADYPISWGNFALIVPVLGLFIALLFEAPKTW